MLRYLSVFSTTIILLTACSNTASLKAYYNTEIDRIKNSYGGNFEKGPLNPENLPSKKELKAFIASYEHSWAISPDSVIARDVYNREVPNREIGTTELDSIYYNNNKKEYLIKHQLKTPGKLFKDK